MILHMEQAGFNRWYNKGCWKAFKSRSVPTITVLAGVQMSDVCRPSNIER